MTGWQIAMLVGVLLVADLAVIGAVFSLCGASIRPLTAAFPPQQPSADAVERRFQSFRFGMLNLGSCIHVAADERYLHLRPAWLARRFAFRDMSIPWSEFQRVRIKGKWGEAVVRSVDMRGPAWCMALASPSQQA